MVINPLDHYSTNPEVVAVPVYERHPITRNVALTFFPGIRSLTLLPPPPGVTSGPLCAGGAAKPWSAPRTP